MGDRYRSTPKYKNTDVSGNTVHNLLQTINSMSQRCKNQANTDDILQRIRTIIVMYRPHLAARLDLQVPELVMEALMPNSTLANQITHNFNYKYDYNTNMPNAPNPFVPQQTQMLQPPTNPNVPANTPLQSFTFNQAPAPTQIAPDNNPPPPPRPPPATSESSAVMLINQEDLVGLNELYTNALRAPSVQTYKLMLQQIIIIVRKYVRYEQLIVSLQLLEQFNTLLPPNLDELLLCIERETRWVLPRGPYICHFISALVMAYCRIATIVTRQTFTISTVNSLELLQSQTNAVEEQLREIMDRQSQLVSNAQAQSLVAEQTQAFQQQIVQLNTALQDKNDQLNVVQSEFSATQTKYNQIENQNSLLTNAFNRLQGYFINKFQISNVNTIDETVNTVINSVENLQSQITSSAVQQANLDAQRALICNDDKSRLQERVNQYETLIAELQLKINDYNDVQAQLKMSHERILQLENQVNNATTQKEQSQAIQLAQLQERLTSAETRNEQLNREIHERSATKIRLPERPSSIVRPSGAGKIKSNRRMEKILSNQKSLINDKQQLTAKITELNRKHKEAMETADESVKRLNLELQSVKSHVEMLSSNQSALGANDLKMLNNRSTQELNDKISRLQAEKSSIEDWCNVEIKRESEELKDQLLADKSRLDNNIRQLMDKLVPIQERVNETATQIGAFEVKYETLARSNARSTNK
jgi:chromosome segregation ATPase